MIMEILQKVLAAFGVYLLLLSAAKVSVHASYAISMKDWKRLVLCMCLMGMLFFLLLLLFPVSGG